MQSSISISTLTTVDDNLFKFFESTVTPCTLKDIQTKKLTIISAPFARLFGASSPSIAPGMTVRDLVLTRLHCNSALNEQYIQRLEALDDRVCETARAITNNKIIFSDHQGFIRIERLVKSPIFNRKKKPVAIISYAQNLTKYYDLLTLFNLYQEYYAAPHAIRYFLRYIEVDQYFVELPTYEEMMTLLTLYGSILQNQGIPHLKGDTLQKKNSYHQLSSKLKNSSLEEMIDLFFQIEFETK
jgi:hypothetical protein